MKKLRIMGRYLRFSVFIVLIILPVAGHSMTNAMDKFFRAMGTDVNTSGPGSFKNQAAGYYTGGGLMVRQKNWAYQPITISPPSFNAGCSGIDAYFGGVSFMGGEQLGNLLRQMGTQAQTYALQLALKTMAPQIENLLSSLRKMALDFNSLMVGDCRQVQQIFASALPKGTAFQEHACIDVKKQGGGEDWFGAKEKCRSPDKIAEGAKQAQEKNPDQLSGEYNLIWHILKKLTGEGLLPDEEKEFWQTMTGTIVHRQEGDRFIHIPYAGKAADDRTWDTLLRGGTLDGLSCEGDKSKCLRPKSVPLTLKEGLKDKISKKIYELQDKYTEGKALSEHDILFLNDVVSVPLWKYIQVFSAAGGSANFEPILDYIALQLLLSQLEKILSEVESHLHLLEAHQQESSQLEAFGKRLQGLKTQLKLRQGPLTYQAIFQLNQMVEMEEKRIRLINGLNS
ncbi:MAG: conjugal transfer protein TraH [Alphaproteobacteria bacterium]